MVLNSPSPKGRLCTRSVTFVPPPSASSPPRRCKWPLVHADVEISLNSRFQRRVFLREGQAEEVDLIERRRWSSARELEYKRQVIRRFPTKRPLGRPHRIRLPSWPTQPPQPHLAFRSDSSLTSYPGLLASTSLWQLRYLPCRRRPRST